jgi:hypothetical protein
MDVPMTGLVEVYEVFLIIRSAILPLYDVVGVQFFSVEQVVTAYRTRPVLISRYFVELRTFFPIGFTVSGHAVLPIFGEFGVIGGSGAFDFNVTFNWNIR